MAFSYGNYATPGAQAYTGSGNVYNGNTPNDQNNFTPDQIKGWFAQNPNATPQQIADTAAQYHMTPGGVAQAISIGTGANYDPGAVRGWLGANAGQTSGGTGGVGGDGVITGSNGYSPGYAGGGSGGGNLGFGGGMGSGSQSSSSSQGGGLNPYLGDMANAMTQQMTDNYTRNVAPANRSGAMAAGGFGGSRQGIVDTNGMLDFNRALGNGLSNLYGTGWQNAQQNNLQQQSINNQLTGINNQYDLGLRSSDLGFAGLDANIANSNFNNQLASANFGLQATGAMNGQTGNAITAGSQMQNMPLWYQQQFANAANAAGGAGQTQTGTFQGSTNPYINAAGGAAMGLDLYNRYNQPGPGSGYSGGSNLGFSPVGSSADYRSSDPTYYG